MDVDAPNILKRCSSAPLINEASSTSAASPTTSSAPRESICFNMFTNSNQHRTRRFSASFSPLVQSTGTFGPRLTPRVSQLRQEECADVSNIREVAHEKEIHNAMQMSQSWEDLTLMTAGLGGTTPVLGGTTPTLGGTAPAPASPTRNNRFSPGVSPSPTRKAFATRSLSPIAMRPSCLSPVNRPSGLVSTKRRFDIDDTPSAKRCCWSSERQIPSAPGTPDSIADSITDSITDSIPDSIIHSPSNFTFRPVSPSVQPMLETQKNEKSQNPS